MKSAEANKTLEDGFQHLGQRTILHKKETWLNIKLKKANMSVIQKNSLLYWRFEKTWMLLWSNIFLCSNGGNNQNFQLIYVRGKSNFHIYVSMSSLIAWCSFSCQTRKPNEMMIKIHEWAWTRANQRHPSHLVTTEAVLYCCMCSFFMSLHFVYYSNSTVGWATHETTWLRELMPFSKHTVFLSLGISGIFTILWLVDT